MAANSNPFAATGTWLRCALHAHTTRSDGELSPDELVSLYERAGFQIHRRSAAYRKPMKEAR